MSGIIFKEEFFMRSLMKKVISGLLITFLMLINTTAESAMMSGGVTKNGINSSNQVLDAADNAPIENAKITIPKNNYKTYTDSDGHFDLDTQINGDTIMSVEKDGYRPFSVTIDENLAKHPIILGIQKSNATDIVIDSNMVHLGDDNYSTASANAGEFKIPACGPFYTKTFYMTASTKTATNYLIIGSVIGIDTAMARSMGQNRITNSFASPPEIYFNGQKIAELHLNGDGQKVKLPNALIRSEQVNEITIKSGRNMMQTAYIDYDDIEFMNLSIQSE